MALSYTWAVVKIMAPFWVLVIIRHLMFRVLKKGAIISTTTHLYSGLGDPSLEDHGT